MCHEPFGPAGRGDDRQRETGRDGARPGVMCGAKGDSLR